MLGLVLWRYAHIYTQIRGLQTHLLDHKHFFLWFFYPLLVYPWKPGKTKLRMTHQEGKCDPGKLKKRLFSCIWHMRCCWVSKTRLNYCKQETILREKKNQDRPPQERWSVPRMTALHWAQCLTAGTATAASEGCGVSPHDLRFQQSHVEPQLWVSVSQPSGVVRRTKDFRALALSSEQDMFAQANKTQCRI